MGLFCPSRAAEKPVKWLALLVWLISAAPAHAADNFNIYLAKAEEGGLKPASAAREFACSDTIYLVVETAAGASQPAQMQAFWIDPAGKERIRAQREFAPRNDRFWSWSGLELSRPAGASLMAFIDPSTGLGDFIGDWKVHVRVGEQTITTIDFDVLC